MVETINISELLGNGTGRIVTSVQETLQCKIGLEPIFWWFLLPLIILVFLLLLLRFKEEIKLKFMLYFSKRGYLRIMFILPNKKIKYKLKKLDKFNTFTIGKRKYNLDKMHDFIVGYDKYNFPIFMYDTNFILPLKVEKRIIDKHIEDNYDLEEIADEVKNKMISQIILKIDSSILKTVYDRKLMSDLYSISAMDMAMRNKILIAVGIVVGFLILWWTGYLDVILSYLGLSQTQ